MAVAFVEASGFTGPVDPKSPDSTFDEKVLDLSSRRRLMKRRRRAGGATVATTLATVLSICAAAALTAASPNSDEPVAAPVFDEDVLPIFQANCLRCHASDVRTGGLDLGTLAGALAGSSTGAVVIPGNPDASKLYDLVRSGAMPFDHQTRVSPAELETIRHWIEALPVSKRTPRPATSSSQHTPVVLHPPTQDNSPASTYRAVLDRYCITCHNEQVLTAGLAFEKLDVSNVSRAAAVWENVVDKLRTGAMPPAGMPRPDQATYDSWAAYLETALDRAAAASPQPGRPAIHRLNRAEYRNAIRDLLAIDIDVESLLPADDSGYGFDNIADLLSVSPVLLERYMSAAGKISRLAIGDGAMHPVLATYRVPPLLMQDERMSEDLPFGTRGGLAIRHDFPVDGEYVIKIRLRRTHNGNINDGRIIGLAEPHQLEVRLDGTRIKLFTIGGKYAVRSRSGREEFLRLESASSLKTSTKKGPEGDTYEYTVDKGLEVRFPAKAGPRLLGVDFVNESSEPEGAFRPRLAALYSLEGYEDTPERVKEVPPALDEVIIEGPYNARGPGETPSLRKVLVCRPAGSEDEIPCAEKILGTLARHAYRRPVNDRNIRILLSLYKAGRREGDFEAGIETALQGILVNPEFLFRIERDPANLAPGTPYRITDLELASRLSFFLWSSIPDDRLLDLAVAGKLKDPGVLEQQVRRMLADSRSKALVSNFAGQWLYLRNIRKVVPDPGVFPDFDENLRDAFERETELFLESNLREDRSVLDLLNADYTFVNDRLARFYGIPNVYGSSFRRVTLSGEERRGLLGQGSILTVTSYANRTSPTVRGKWLLENVLGTPPPPPPPDVPSLKEENTENGRVLTMRQRMEEHRANPACAVCHTRMDPLGFALENFDAIGKWRTAEGNTPIDASGVLPDGTKFDGPAGLRKVLLSHPEEFVTTVTEKLLTYALGRGLEYYDAPAVRKITREAAAGNYRWSSLILGIVKSVPFQMRMSKPQDPIKVTDTATQVQAIRSAGP
jgi:mono/diheme cytochrome c family protein